MTDQHAETVPEPEWRRNLRHVLIEGPFIKGQRRLLLDLIDSFVAAHAAQTHGSISLDEGS